MYEILIHFRNGCEAVVSNVVDDEIDLKTKTLKLITDDDSRSYFNFETICYYGKKETIENKVTYNYE